MYTKKSISVKLRPIFGRAAGQKKNWQFTWLPRYYNCLHKRRKEGRGGRNFRKGLFLLHVFLCSLLFFDITWLFRVPSFLDLFCQIRAVNEKEVPCMLFLTYLPHCTIACFFPGAEPSELENIAYFVLIQICEEINLVFLRTLSAPTLFFFRCRNSKSRT